MKTRQKRRNPDSLSHVDAGSQPPDKNLFEVSPPAKKRATNICFTRSPARPLLISSKNASGKRPFLYCVDELLPRIRELVRTHQSFLVAATVSWNAEKVANPYAAEKNFCRKLIATLDRHRDEDLAAVNKLLEAKQSVVNQLELVEKEWGRAISAAWEVIGPKGDKSSYAANGLNQLDFSMVDKGCDAVMKEVSRLSESTAAIKFDLQRRMDLINNDETVSASNDGQDKDNATKN